jgi:hypothetical protein
MVAARSVRAATGQTVCVTVTHMDGLVLALERQSPAEPQGIGGHLGAPRRGRRTRGKAAA